MSLDTVVEDIREEAEERREEIISEAEERREEIISEAESEGEEIVTEAEAEVEDEIEQERERRLSSATLEAKQQRLEARRDALSEARDVVEQRVADLDGEKRRELTASLVEATVAEFDEESVEVYGREEDEELLTDLLDEHEGVAYAGEYDCLGGLVAESEQSRVRVNNTFDTLLEEVWDDHLREISDRLFGEQ